MWALVLYRLAPGRLVSERLGFPLSIPSTRGPYAFIRAVGPLGAAFLRLYTVSQQHSGFCFEILQHPFEMFFRRVRKISRSDTIISSCLPASLFAWNSSASTGRVYTCFDIEEFFRKNLLRNDVWLKSDKNNRQTLCVKKYSTVCAFMISRWVLLGVRTVLCLEMMWKIW
jgi:hypothetical protein